MNCPGKCVILHFGDEIMRIVTLMENTCDIPYLNKEHGLSLYIETAHHKILFDTGASGSFAENAQKLGVDLRDVDIAVLSHGHNDHSGGLERFFESNDHAPVYLLPAAGEAHFSADGRFIGLPQEILQSSRLRFACEGEVIGQGLSLHTGNDRVVHTPVDTAGLTVLRDGVRVPDDFSHEQYLLIQEDGRKVLISGCSHKGILNIAGWFAPDVLIGGFHFFREQPDGARVTEAARKLLSYPTVYYTGHCTGVEQYIEMKKIMADRLHYLSTGSEIIL